MEIPLSKKKLRSLMPEKLVKFLKKRKILTIFIDNTVSYYSPLTNEELQDLIKSLNSGYAIVSAFTWTDCTDSIYGIDFWYDLEYQWADEFYQ